jgi:carboxymethylenebutenolidase
VAGSAKHAQNAGVWGKEYCIHMIFTEQIEISASDGHLFCAFRARPEGGPVGTVLIAQEIFGVTAHIRAVAEQYARAGYEAVAPQLFDRHERDLVVPYTEIPLGLRVARSIDMQLTLLDLEACRLAAADPLKVGIVGFCWGGRTAYMASCRLALKAAVSYYGVGIPACLSERPMCPIQFHFGSEDHSTPEADIAAIRAAVPSAECYLYPTGHAFNNADRTSFEPASAALALSRALDFFQRHLH